MTRVMKSLARTAILVLLVALLAATTADVAAAKQKKKKNKGVPVAIVPPPPITPPPPSSVPQLSAATVDSAHVALSWSPVNGAASYAVYRGGMVIARLAATAFSDSMLWPSTSYDYRVDALDPSGAVVANLSSSATTAPLPAAGIATLFSTNSIWNTPVGSAQPVANSSALVSYLAANALHPNMTLRSWGVSVAEAQPGQPSYGVPCVTWTVCTLGAFGPVPIPTTAAADPSGDGHLAVYDPASGREWDMWEARSTPAGWTAGAGAAISTDGNGIAPEGTASGDAANFPLLGGLVRPEEILQGHIDHALVFGMPNVSKLGHTCPATHNDGSSTDPNALQEGMHVQLDPTLNVDQLPIPAWEKTVARAMQTYGMYLRDGGGSLAIYAEDSASRGYDAWAKVGVGSGSSVGLAGIPWDHFRVISAPC